MPLNFGDNVQMNGNQLLGFKFEVLVADPTGLTTGDEARGWYNSTDKTIKFWNGTAVVVLATGSNATTLAGQAASYYLARANHTGVQAASTINDLAAVVKAYRLDEFTAPTNPVPFGSQRITNLADPTSAQDGATKAYVDTVIATGTNKGTARVSPTGNINTASPGATHDGVTLANGDLMLLTAQSTASQNGLYVYNGASTAMTRASNADTSAEVKPGMSVFVSEGTTKGNTVWVLTTDDPITLGTTALTFTQTNAGTSYTAGTGIAISGNAIALDTANNYGVRSKAFTIGDGSATSFTITHNLGTRNVTVNIWQTASPYGKWETSVQAATVNTVTLTFAVAPGVGAYSVVVQG